MRHFLLLGLLAFPALAAAPRHAYHSSLMELKLAPGNQEVQISIKVFADDLEKALNNGRPAPIDLRTPMAMPVIERYLHEHIKVTMPAVRHTPRLPQDVQFKGMQREKDVYWLYCKVPLIHATKELLLRNDLMLELYADQKNIVNAEGNEKKLSVLFRKGHEEEFLYF